MSSPDTTLDVAQPRRTGLVSSVGFTPLRDIAPVIVSLLSFAAVLGVTMAASAAVPPGSACSARCCSSPARPNSRC